MLLGFKIYIIWLVLKELVVYYNGKCFPQRLMQGYHR